jgi:histone-lysine N-methyltransferase SETMAR
MENEFDRYYIKIRTILGTDPTTIHQELSTAIGSNAPSYSTFARWAKRFREGREDVDDEPRSGRPISELTDRNIELVRQIINNDPHSTYDDIIAETSLSHGTVERIIHDHLKMKKVTSRWVPHELTDEQKQERVRICRENLARFQSGSWRLCDIITGDETWIHHRQIGRKSTNKSWVGEGETPTTIVRRSKFEPRTLFCIFFKSNSPVLVHAVGKGKTIDHQYYIENCLKPVVKEIWKQRKSSGTNGVKLLHDNARPHVHSDVIDYLTKEGINIMSHPPYSSDLAPCDYWLNDYIKRHLTDQTNEKSLARAITKIVKKIPKEEFKKTFDKLLERMEVCINNHGDYFEHLMK